MYAAIDIEVARYRQHICPKSIRSPYLQHILTVFQIVGNLITEGCIATLVLAHAMTVYKNVGNRIHTLKAQEQSSLQLFTVHMQLSGINHRLPVVFSTLSVAGIPRVRKHHLLILHRWIGVADGAVHPTRVEHLFVISICAKKARKYNC